MDTEVNKTLKSNCVFCGWPVPCSCVVKPFLLTYPPHENAPSCFIYNLWPFPCSFRLRQWRKNTTQVRWGWDTLTLSASSSVGFGEQTAGSALLPSVGHVASCRSCCPHVNHSVPLTQWERGDAAASRSVNHIRPLHTHFLCLLRCPSKALNLPHTGSCPESLQPHLGNLTAVSV